MAALADRERFVGREREMARLRGVLDTVARGSGRIVTIEGEPGIGKTRLLQEFARSAREAGWLVLVGHAYDSEGMPPYLPFVEALREYAVAVPGAQRIAMAPEVAALIPNVRTTLVDKRERPQLDPASERYRLFEAMCDWFADLASARDPPGLVLALEDLHWGDESTLLLVEHFSRRLHEAPVLLILTYRDTELVTGSALARTVEQVSGLGIAESDTLRPLDKPGVAALLTSLGGPSPPDQLVQVIHGETEGNPLFVREVFSYLEGEGRLFDGEGHWRASLHVGEAEVPRGIQRVIRGRLQRLSPGCLAALTVASVIGRLFDFELLREVSRAHEPELLDALDEAARAHLVSSASTAGGAHLMFTHELVRQTLASDLALPHRRSLHRAIAEAIERFHADDLAPYSAELAQHFRLGARPEDTEKAIEYSLRAGESARAVFAYQEAAIRWETALELMDGGSSRGPGRAGPDLRRARVLERLGDLMFLMDWQNGIGHMEQALATYEQLGETTSAARVHSKLGRCLSQFGESMDIDRATQHYEAAKAVLSQAPEQVALGHVYLGIAVAAISSVRTRDGLSASRQAMELAERLDNESLWAGAASVHGWHVFAGGDVAGGLALMERAFEKAERLNSPAAFFAAWVAGELVYLVLQDPGDSPRLLHRELASERLAYAPLQRRVALAEIGWALVAAGDLPGARRILPDANPDWPLDAKIETMGDWEWAETRFAAEQEKFGARGDLENQWRCCWWRGQLYRTWRRYDEAQDLFTQALEFFAAAPHVPMEVAIRADLALLCAQRGRASEAEPQLSRCRQVMTNPGEWRGLAGRVELAEAMMAADMDSERQTRSSAAPSRTPRRFEHAIGIFRRYTLPWDEVETLHLWGQTLLTAGRRQEAVEKFDASVEIYRRHGAGQRFVDFVEADRRRAGGPTSHPDGLSAREVEVLGLIATGKTNPAIAEALFISLNTVERHVNHILTKTNLSNRVELANYAHAHDLADLLATRTTNHRR